MTAFRTIPSPVLDRHIAVLAMNGAGKTYGVKGTIIEPLLLDGKRVCILDPTGVYWGLRLDPQGHSPSGLDVVIFGGPNGDFIIGGDHGEVVAEVIAATSRSAIIDTSDMTVGQRTKFFAAFGETLLRKNRAPLHLVIDEAHLFAPQGRVNDPMSGRMLHAANNLISLGRSRGLRVTLISQRPAKLHKDSLTQAHSLVVMKLVAPQDREAAKAWIEGQPDQKRGAEVLASLAGLQVGKGWLWAPEIDALERIEFPAIKTFDSSRAPDDAGDWRVPLPKLDTDDIRAMIQSSAAEAVANDPAELKKRIADLEAQLATAVHADAATARAATLGEEEYKRGHREGFDQAFAMGVNSFTELWSNVLKSINPIRFATDELQVWVDQLFDVVDGRSAKEKGGGTLADAPPEAWHRYDQRPQQWPPQESGSSPALPSNHSADTAPMRPLPGRAAAAMTDDFSHRNDPFAFRVVEENTGDVIPARKESTVNGKRLTPAQLRILDALAWQESIKVTESERTSLAFLADASPKSSAFANNLGMLRTSGLVEYRAGSRVALTERGHRFALKPKRRLTHADILRSALAHLVPAQGRIVEHVARVYPKDVTRSALAQAVGASHTSSAYANNLGRLRSLGLIVYRPESRVRADDRLFP